MAWNTSRRPKISNKLGIPTQREGSDGDIQIRQTNLGGKLFGKIGGRWYSAPLAFEEGEVTTRIGVNLSDHLSIDSDSVDVYKDSIKVASFGSTTTIGDTGNEHAKISSDGMEIKDGSRSIATFGSDVKLSGKIIMGNTDGSYDTDDSIVIGNDQSNIGFKNVYIGYQAGKDSTSTSIVNVAIGYQAGANIAGGGATLGENICIGYRAGDTLTTGDRNIFIGSDPDTDNSDGDERIAIGYGVICDDNETVRIGQASNYLLYDFAAGGAVTITSDERIKKDIVDTDIGLEFINALRPIKFKRKNKHDYPNELFQGGINPVKDDLRGSDPTAIVDGFIGQEVKEVMDDLDVTFSGWRENNSSRQMLSYSIFVVPLTKAVQELSAKLDTMQTEINNLKAGE